MVYRLNNAGKKEIKKSGYKFEELFDKYIRPKLGIEYSNAWKDFRSRGVEITTFRELLELINDSRIPYHLGSGTVTISFDDHAEEPPPNEKPSEGPHSGQDQQFSSGSNVVNPLGNRDHYPLPNATPASHSAEGVQSDDEPKSESSEPGGRRSRLLPPVRRIRADVVRMFRDAKAWGNEELAKRAGIDSLLLTKALADGEAISLEIIVNLANVLGAKPDEILFQEEGGKRLTYVTLVLETITKDEYECRLKVDPINDAVARAAGMEHKLVSTSVFYGSVSITMLIQRDDAFRLVSAFADAKLDFLGESEIIIPRRPLLLAIAASVAHGHGNPLSSLLQTVVGFCHILNNVNASTSQFDSPENDLVVLKRPTSNEPAHDSSAPTRETSNLSLIRGAIEVVTPTLFAPSFPLEYSIHLTPAGPDGDPIELNSRLEQLLLRYPQLQGKVSRCFGSESKDGNPAQWSGQLLVQLTSIDDWRTLTEAVLIGFIGQPVFFETKREVSGKSYTQKTSSKVNLSAKLWDAIDRDASELSRIWKDFVIDLKKLWNPPPS